MAVTGPRAASLPEGELQEAQRLAALIGIRHEIVATDEMSNPDYVKNGSDRCYFCKTELYSRIEPLVARLGVKIIANGANLDDTGDHRPGMIAAGEHQVRSPLHLKIAMACGRLMCEQLIAAEWQLPIWDKPAAPALSSRLAYGEASHARAAGDGRSRRSNICAALGISHGAGALPSGRSGSA